MSGVARVLQNIRRQSGAPVARGELMLDVKFARAFLQWQAPDAVAGLSSPADLLIACCRALKLDLVCLQSEGAADNEAGPATNLNDIRRFGDQGLFVFWVVNGAFQTAIARRGMMAFLTDIAQSPAEVGRELHRISDQAAATMAQGVAAGAHGIILADDIAYQQSTYVSPDFIGQQLLPVWQILTARAAELGVPVFLHSDGNLNAVLPAVVAAGFDGLQCIEPAAGMDIREIKKTYRRKLCLMGNLDPTLLYENVPGKAGEDPQERLRRAVSSLLAAADDQGGLIFGTCSGLHAGMSPELVHYMYQLVSALNPVSSGGSV